MSAAIHSENPYVNAWRMVKSYCLSPDRPLVLLQLFGIFLSMIAMVGLTVMLAWCTTGLWAAFSAMQPALFVQTVQQFGLILLTLTGVKVIRDYLCNLLEVNWTRWLTEKLITQYTIGETNYLDLKRNPDKISNPEDRIKKDVPFVIKQTIKLGRSALNCGLIFLFFSANLWVLGGGLAFTVMGLSLTIPGYLVWASLAFTITGGFITARIGRNLSSLNSEEKEVDADLRKELLELGNKSESIAQEHGAVYYKNSLLTRLGNACRVFYKKMLIQLNLAAFESVFLGIAPIFPLLMTAPAYFAGVIPLAAIMEITFSFNIIRSEVMCFINSYYTLANYAVSVNRVSELSAVLAEKKPVMPECKLRSPENAIELENVVLYTPDNQPMLAEPISVAFSRGSKVEIRAHTGAGKSTMMKMLAGVWDRRTGEVRGLSAQSKADPHQFFVLAQTPTIRANTLRANLAYPLLESEYEGNGPYERVLRMVGLAEFIPDLDNSQKDWANAFSGGQKQKMFIARALLHKPEILIMDESTSALDEGNEELVYRVLGEELRESTILSISHKKLDKYGYTLFEMVANQMEQDAANDGVVHGINEHLHSHSHSHSQYEEEDELHECLSGCAGH